MQPSKYNTTSVNNIRQLLSWRYPNRTVCDKCHRTDLEAYARDSIQEHAGYTSN